MSANINIVQTSDDSIIKFEAEEFLVNHQSFEYHNIDEAKSSPLAQQLFYLPFVKTVYIAQNFVAIQKYSIVEWEDVAEDVAQQISQRNDRTHTQNQSSMTRFQNCIMVNNNQEQREWNFILFPETS